MEAEKNYDPKKYEAGIYRLWEESGAFKPDDKKGVPFDSAHGKPFTIIMPPPNANGKLHWGHAIGYSTEDMIIRYKRMRGFAALWLPGTDHAGIETQFVYERDVLAPQGKSRFDLGPDKFYDEVMDYTKKSGKTIIDQFRAMGFSADWSKLKFTLDDDIVDIVYDTFKKLHADGHIYRGNRIVNWCVRCQAAFADIELERREQTDELYVMDYGPLRIATVRPETIFADVAVAVHPEDERYKDLIGQKAVIPLVNREVPIISDKHVDPDFGTGALKITPGHDPNDYEIGRRHDLPEISVVDLEGKMVNVPEEFAGLGVEEGRQAIDKALRADGKLTGKEPYRHAVAIHDRCGSLIEPLISEQWFLRIKELNRPVIEAFKSGEIEVFPKRFTKIALNWLEQERDWCISRQIWWGIRIPVYYKTSHDPDKKPYIIAKTEKEAEKYYGKENYRAETDTFDTWFSSGQWPFATLMSTGDFDKFYPTSLMGTAREILHKWVTRMVMFGIYRTGEVPFRQVYLWGMVTDEQGRKMSKSKGNVIDPMVITDKYGTDALRLAGAISNTPGNDSPMAEKRVEAMRNFNNKLWNVARFILSKTDETYRPSTPRPQGLADEWILSRLTSEAKEIGRLFDNYRLNEAVEKVYHLLWSDFADWYIEASKTAENLDLLVYGLETILKLTHPFAPFITETVWQKMPWHNDMLITAEWPRGGKVEKGVVDRFSELQRIVTEIRNLSLKLSLNKPTLYHFGHELLESNAELITHLAGLDSCESVSDGRGLPVPGTAIECWLDVDEDTVERYRETLRETLRETEGHIKSMEAKLANKAYTRNAPKEVVKETRERLKATQERSQTLSRQLERLD